MTQRTITAIRQAIESAQEHCDDTPRDHTDRFHLRSTLLKGQTMRTVLTHTQRRQLTAAVRAIKRYSRGLRPIANDPMLRKARGTVRRLGEIQAHNVHVLDRAIDLAVASGDLEGGA